MNMSDINKHADLVDRMEAKLGIDVIEEVVRGRISATALRNQVFRCMHCTEVDACEAFLAKEDDGAKTAPEYCRNRMLYGRMAPARSLAPRWKG